MQVHMQNAIAALKKRVLTMSAAVEENVNQAVKAVQNGDTTLAARIIAGDREIDAVEVEIEEDCLEILALHQPVAVDLRFLIVILKMNNDLERIADLAVNIAERARYFSDTEPIAAQDFLLSMANKARLMLRQSLDAVVNLDTAVARQVLAADDEVDTCYQDITRQMKRQLEKMPVNVEQQLQVIMVAKHIERIADLATNIAEDAIYMVDGEIVRHGRGAEPEDEPGAETGA
jgi:phosphate transport system protein